MDELGNDPGNETNDDGPEDVPHGGCPVLLIAGAMASSLRELHIDIA
jgi:hypothetical protein